MDRLWSLVFCVASFSVATVIGVSNVRAEVIDFDFIVGSGTQDFSLPYQEDGYSVSVNAGQVRVNEYIYADDGVAFPNFGFDEQLMTVAKTDGSAFDVLEMVFGEVQDFDPDISFAAIYAFDVVGVKMDGSGTVVQSILLDGVKGLETFSLSGFTALSSIYFGSVAYGMEAMPQNVVLSSMVTQDSEVPLPAAIWLFMAGLGGLGYAGRRRGAAA